MTISGTIWQDIRSENEIEKIQLQKLVRKVHSGKTLLNKEFLTIMIYHVVLKTSQECRINVINFSFVEF